MLIVCLDYNIELHYYRIIRPNDSDRKIVFNEMYFKPRTLFSFASSRNTYECTIQDDSTQHILIKVMIENQLRIF